MFALIAIIVVAVIVVGGVAVFVRSYFGNTSEVDQLRKVDEHAAENVERWRAEEGIRGIGQKRF